MDGPIHCCGRSKCRFEAAWWSLVFVEGFSVDIRITKKFLKVDMNHLSGGTLHEI